MVAGGAARETAEPGAPKGTQAPARCLGTTIPWLGMSRSGAAIRAGSSPPILESESVGTPSKELRHGRAPALCGNRSLVCVNGHDVRIYPFHCRRWRCGRCGSTKLKVVRERFKSGLIGQTYVVTLTSPGNEDPGVSWDRLGTLWKAFHLRMEREFGRFEYVRITELQDRGNPHLHIVVRGIKPTRAWVARAAADLGFGRMAKVTRSNRRTVSYLTKALGPGTDGDNLPRHSRRVVFSSGWAPRKTATFKRPEGVWMIALATAVRTAESLLARGFRIVQLVLGPPDRWRWPRYAPVEWFTVEEFFARSGRAAA